jgi:hypothetical protein
VKPTLVTAQDVIEFANRAGQSARGDDRQYGAHRAELLGIEDGNLCYLLHGYITHGEAETGARVTVGTQTEATILLDREEIFGGRFGDCGTTPLTEQAAAAIADTINRETGLAIAAAIYDAHAMGEAAELDAQRAQASALRRAEAVMTVVDLCDGNQSKAARQLGLDPSTVNRLVQKARAV